MSLMSVMALMTKSRSPLVRALKSMAPSFFPDVAREAARVSAGFRRTGVGSLFRATDYCANNLWCSQFSHCSGLRRRSLMCYFKQWRWARAKVRELRKLGTSLYAAISVAISRKGPWHLSRTLAMQTGMTNKWLKDQGLLSVKELWVHIHYPATAR